MMRGDQETRGEWSLHCVAYNLRKLHLESVRSGKKGENTSGSEPISRTNRRPTAKTIRGTTRCRQSNLFNNRLLIAIKKLSSIVLCVLTSCMWPAISCAQEVLSNDKLETVTVDANAREMSLEQWARTVRPSLELIRPPHQPRVSAIRSIGPPPGPSIAIPSIGPPPVHPSPAPPPRDSGSS